MAIVLKKVKQNNGNDLIINSNMIIGVMGNEYKKVLKTLSSIDIYYMSLDDDFKKEKVIDEVLYYNKDLSKEILLSFLKELGLQEIFLEYTINNLSSSEKKLLKYLIMLTVNPKIIVIDEPFIDLDYYYKKKISILLKSMIRNTKKTVIIGSNNSNIIYNLCRKVLFVDNNKCVYGNTTELMIDKKILKDYNIEDTNILKFINLSREKGINIPYSNSINDLIKDVYRNV